MGPMPQERRYHSASVVGDEVLVFGGQYYDASADLHFECDAALCVFSLKDSAWTTIPADATTPLRRACHAAGVVGKKVYLIGGRYWDMAEDDYIFLNDIQILHRQSHSTLPMDWKRFVNNEVRQAATSLAPVCDALTVRCCARIGLRSTCPTSRYRWAGARCTAIAWCSRRDVSTFGPCLSRACESQPRPPSACLMISSELPMS